MSYKTPVVKDKIFTLWDYDADQSILELDISDPNEWEYWQKFLDDELTKSFRFIEAEGVSCTVVKELRPHFNNKDDLRPVWYAHKRLDGKQCRKYLGKSENVTYSRLKAVVRELVKGK